MSNAFKDWDMTRVAEHNARVASKTKPVVKPADIVVKEKVNVEDTLNELEKSFLRYLRHNYPPHFNYIATQAITLRLASGLTYRPDFSRWERNQRVLHLYETKGPHRFRDKGLAKLKAAAALYPYFNFHLVEKSKDGWVITKMAP